MHEIGILTQVVETVERLAAENRVKRVAVITLEIGELSGVLPVFMEELFPVVTEGNPLFENAELNLVNIRGEGLCLACNALYNIMEHEGRCPVCGSRDKTVLGGQDFVLKEITVYQD